MLVRFASMSSLKINFDKTNAVWIGSEKDSRIRFLPHLEFKWNPATFKVLGIHFSTNPVSYTHLTLPTKIGV